MTARMRTAVPLLFGLTLLSLAVSANATVNAFTTFYGLGPDKWAAAWVLVREAEPGAKLQVVDRSKTLPSSATAFDVSSSPLRRTRDRSATEVVIEAYGVTGAVPERLLAAMHEIEVEFWEPERSADARAIEHAFRALQLRAGRDRIPADCYLAFFDSVAEAFQRDRARRGIRADSLLKECDGERRTVAKIAATEPVREIPVRELMTALRTGKRVVFVDVREPEEYAEVHIPGAVNLQIRHLQTESVAPFADADLVVSYCVKDFRGFEMAKLLQRAGVRRSVILNPYGLKGWIASGLPVAGDDALTEEEARAELAACLASGDCLRGDRS